MMKGGDMSQSVTVEVFGRDTIAEVYTRAHGLPEDSGVLCYATLAGVLQGSDVVACLGLAGQSKAASFPCRRKGIRQPQFQALHASAAVPK